MRFRLLPAAVVAAALIVPATASAAFVHVVGAGESLSSIAAADGLPVSALAAANGLSLDSQLISGQALQIPPQGVAVPPPASAPTATTTAASVTSAGYRVQPGDTLSAIAAANGLTVDQLAAANGVDPAAVLVSGTTISVPGARAPATPVTTGASSAAARGAQPTAATVSAGQVGSIAAANGVSPSLAEAIGWQESGFNNGLVSSTGATGVMQIEPGTWQWIGQNLVTPPPLSSASASDNVRGGVILLHSLLAQTGGDSSLAAAGYYQGLESVRRHGMYADTQRYVNDVMALRGRFGGP
ncbi:MAG: LysM peptidoglycan-binding domain-containing protein [Solirubrobacteraceae bacterium]